MQIDKTIALVTGGGSGLGAGNRAPSGRSGRARGNP